ncbi:hypothetical protein AXF42_Ash007012 [Apostasia shenzhenica]|uniref:Uncharacterized protein n=1 Tax=Apostasia shenzhenica TaxID=1088818 RepID=A0A2I0BES9_9ASPA|nr:hypothetical protein AXF42_Ash007012 [Apostasia shenzhenica]
MRPPPRPQSGKKPNLGCTRKWQIAVRQRISATGLQLPCSGWIPALRSCWSCCLHFQQLQFHEFLRIQHFQQLQHGCSVQVCSVLVGSVCCRLQHSKSELQSHQRKAWQTALRWWVGDRMRKPQCRLRRTARSALAPATRVPPAGMKISVSACWSVSLDRSSPS